MIKSIWIFAALLGLAVLPAPVLAKEPAGQVNMDSSNSDIQVAQTQKTRFGTALLVSNDGLPPSIIIFNGKKVFEDEGMYVSMVGYFRTKDADVILVGSNPGGSATPDSPMSFLVIHSASQAEVLTDPDFAADTPNMDEVKKWMDKEGRIFVKLGFRDGNEMVAELNSGKLVVHAYSRKGMPLSDDLCQWLYDNGKESCISEVAHNEGCAHYANPAGIYSSVSDMTQLTYIRNQPGYNQAGFNQSCLAWCKGKDISYQQFRRTACRTK